jgi:hypothetical protein
MSSVKQGGGIDVEGGALTTQSVRFAVAGQAEGPGLEDTC